MCSLCPVISGLPYIIILWGISPVRFRTYSVLGCQAQLEFINEE